MTNVISVPAAETRNQAHVQAKLRLIEEVDVLRADIEGKRLIVSTLVNKSYRAYTDKTRLPRFKNVVITNFISRRPSLKILVQDFAKDACFVVFGFS